MFANSMLIQVGGITFAISGAERAQYVAIPEVLRNFRCSSRPDITIHLRDSVFPAIPLCDENRVFDSRPQWSVYEVDGRQVLAVQPSDLGAPRRTAIFDPEFESVEVFSSASALPIDSGSILLVWPLGQLLMVYLLSRGRGLMVHACAIVDGSKGYLCLGNSGHGKSTMARLWHGKATILNDDRIILRQDGVRFWMFGSPWHGDYPHVSHRGVPLHSIFFLKQSTRNTIVPVRSVEACAMLLSRSFPPQWDRKGMSFTLDFAARLTSEIACYELGFRCDESVTDFIRCVK
jgi:hypothetical protein